MKTDFLLAITQLAAERNLPKEIVFSAVETALVTAFKKDELGARQNISVKIHPVTGDVKVYTTKVVVEEPDDPYQEISLKDARKFKKDAKLDEMITIETADFHSGRIAAQTAKQVVLQRLREAEREFIFGEYIDREGDVVSGIVQRIEPRQIVIDLGKTEGIVPASEQVRNERYRVGQRLKVFLLEVNRTNRGPRLILSRSHPNLVRRLFELEVPEIFNGNVEIKAVAREAGYRSKVAVSAMQEGLDPVGSCVGLRGVRIQNVVSELNNERIDVIQWDDDPKSFISNALSPAQVFSVDIEDNENTAVVVVPDNQLSLAIGKEGQNARLAARISGWRIDIKSVSAVEAEKAAGVRGRKKEVAEIEAKEVSIVEEEAEKPRVSISEEQYDMPLQELGLSVRTLNLLLESGLVKTGELVDKSDKDLLSIRGLGKKSLEEISQQLESIAIEKGVVEEVEIPEIGIGAEIGEELEIVEEVAEVVEEAYEEEVEVIPYEETVEEVAEAEKAQIRFAEDIFGPKTLAGAGTEGKKKSKKKKTTREERLEDSKQRKGKRARVISRDEPEFEDYEVE
jgi:N utilization substance protein A